MVNLLDLPQEILIIIIKQLDIKTVCNLYKTCRILKNIILQEGVVRRCNLSRNTFATVQALQVGLIKHVLKNVYMLNMSGVSGLYKTSFLPIIREMKCLKTLDVSCTDIEIFDIEDIYNYCRTIKNISFSLSAKVRLTDGMINDLQEVFKNFVNVHFVIRGGISNTPLHILKKSSIDTVTYSITDTHFSTTNIDYGETDTICPFKHLCIFMVNYSKATVNERFWKNIMPQVKLDNVELIIIQYCSKYSVCTTPMFLDFFSENFKPTPLSCYDVNKLVQNVVAVFIWNKNTCNFDETFFFQLNKRMKEILLCDLNINSVYISPMSIDMLNYEWFQICQTSTNITVSGSKDNTLNFKENTVQYLDYDKIFAKHDNLKLRIEISHPVIISLLSTNVYLSKLTYLSLIGPLVHHSDEFFNVLFSSCKHLVTLNIETLFSCSSINSIQLSQSLKNIRLKGKDIDFKILFSFLTQCKTLENISVIDGSKELIELPDFDSMFQLNNLSCVYIHAMMNKRILEDIANEYESLGLRYPDHYIKLILDCYNTGGSYLWYEPYLHIYKLSPMRPV